MVVSLFFHIIQENVLNICCIKEYLSPYKIPEPKCCSHLRNLYGCNIGIMDSNKLKKYEGGVAFLCNVHTNFH